MKQILLWNQNLKLLMKQININYFNFHLTWEMQVHYSQVQKKNAENLTSYGWLSCLTFLNSAETAENFCGFRRLLLGRRKKERMRWIIRWRRRQNESDRCIYTRVLTVVKLRVSYDTIYNTLFHPKTSHCKAAALCLLSQPRISEWKQFGK
jgi:hypothetical protein